MPRPVAASGGASIFDLGAAGKWTICRRAARWTLGYRVHGIDAEFTDGTPIARRAPKPLDCPAIISADTRRGLYQAYDDH